MSNESFFIFCEFSTTDPKGKESVSRAVSVPCALPDITRSLRVSPENESWIGIKWNREGVRECV